MKDNVDLGDFVAMEARLFYPAFYSWARSNAGILTNQALLLTKKSSRQKNVSPCLQQASKHYLERLLRIFSHFLKTWSRNSEQVNARVQYARARRICSSEYFPTYFQFYVGNETLTHKEVMEGIGALAEPELMIALVKRYENLQEINSVGGLVPLRELRTRFDLVPTALLEAVIVSAPPNKPLL